jgi:hypothetical protein
MKRLTLKTLKGKYGEPDSVYIHHKKHMVGIIWNEGNLWTVNFRVYKKIKSTKEENCVWRYARIKTLQTLESAKRFVELFQEEILEKLDIYYEKDV